MSLTLRIRDVAFGGKGVAQAEDGRVVFVPFTIDGEEVTAEIVRAKKKFADGWPLSIEQASPNRVEPRCPYFGECGGCSYQHIAYAHQLDIKARQVEQTLRRVGRIESVPMRPMISSPLEYEYRNRIRVHARDGIVGFYRVESQELLDIEHCPISSAEVNDSLAALRRANVGDGDYLLSERHGGPYFAQTNPFVGKALLDLVGSLVEPTHETLIDAYCGAGFFARHLSAHFARIIGIEENIHAVEQARRAAGPHDKYIAGDVAAFLAEALAEGDAARTTLILDPPATGISPRVSDLTLAGRPAEILYVSCNPATLARDLQILCRTYRLDSVTPLDMFPQTAEIEVVARLSADEV